MLTQWKINLGRKKLAHLRSKIFKAEFCEPREPLPATSNALALFLGRNGQVLWTRRVMVPLFENFDYQTAKGELAGGRTPLKSIELQLKIPANEFTQQVGWLQITLDDGLVLEPSRWVARR